jgi:hypothetical protein
METICRPDVSTYDDDDEHRLRKARRGAHAITQTPPLDCPDSQSEGISSDVMSVVVEGAGKMRVARVVNISVRCVR